MLGASYVSAAQAEPSAPAVGTNYYVDGTNGSDTGTGSFADPKQTVQAGVNLLSVGGDVLYIRSGTYNLSADITFPNSGNSTDPITVKNYPGEQVILDRGYFTPPDSLWHPVFLIEGVDYIHIAGSTEGGTLHLRGGAIGNVVIANNDDAWGVQVRNVYFSRLITYDNSAQVYIGIGSAKTVGGIAADGDPASAKIRIQDCYADGDSTVPDPFNKASDAFYMSFSNLGDCEIVNNVVVGGNLGIFFKHGTANNGVTLVQGNILVNQYYSPKGTHSIGINRNNALVRDNLIVGDLATGVWVYVDTSDCSRTPATGTQILHNTFYGSRHIWLYGQTSRACTSAFQSVVRDNVGRNTTGLMSIEIWSYDAVDNSDSTVEYNLMQRTGSTSENIVRVLASGYPIGALPVSVTSTQNIQSGLLFTDTGNVDPLLNDYSLQAGSAGKNAASTGNDMGADFSKVGRYMGT